MPPSARHQVQVLLSMGGAPARLAHGGPAEPRGVVELPPPPVEPSGSRDEEAGPPTRVQEAVPQTRQPTPSGAAAAQTPPDVPTNQAAASSSATVSSGGEHAKRPADPTVEEEIPMSEILRPRGRPITRVLPMPGTAEHTEGCPGCRGDGYCHNAHCRRRVAERAASASHAGGAASRVGGAITFQTTSHAASGAASSSHVGGVSNQSQIATHAGVQAQAGPTAVHVGAANQETQLRSVDQDMADAQTDHDMADVVRGSARACPL